MDKEQQIKKVTIEIIEDIGESLKSINNQILFTKVERALIRSFAKKLVEIDQKATKATQEANEACNKVFELKEESEKNE